MKDFRFDSAADAGIFAGARPNITLADVVARVTSDLDGNERRDTISAFNVLSKRTGLDLNSTPANVPAVRVLLARVTDRDLQVRPKRLANIRSLIKSAVERFGMPRTWVTRDIALADDWKALLAQAPRPEYRWALGRLACYCTVKDLRPDAVSSDTLRGFFAALEGDMILGNPRNILKQTIANWNMCQRRVASWPSVRLSSPFRSDPYMLPLAAFPESFQAEVADWEARMSCPDPLDPAAPLRPLRPATMQSYRDAFRRIASALVRRNILEVKEITGFAVLVDENNLREALRAYLPDGGSRSSGYVHKMAVQMANVARHVVRLDAEQLKSIDRLVRHLDPRTAGKMGERNRTRLMQFDDAAVVQRLLRFPEEEYARALRISNPFRRAKGVERALAISLLIFTGIRVQNLRNLRLDRDVIRREDGRARLRFAGDQMKTGAELELELPAGTIRLLDAFVGHHRDTLPGASSPFLFPSPTGDARSYSSMRLAVSVPLRKHCGIELSPHLYRHIIAKIVVEREPGMLPDLSRRLGHKSINTTYQAYLGTETPAASRRINQLLETTRGEPNAGRS